MSAWLRVPSSLSPRSTNSDAADPGPLRRRRSTIESPRGDIAALNCDRDLDRLAVGSGSRAGQWPIQRSCHMPAWAAAPIVESGDRACAPPPFETLSASDHFSTLWPMTATAIWRSVDLPMQCARSAKGQFRLFAGAGARVAIALPGFAMPWKALRSLAPELVQVSRFVPDIRRRFMMR